MATTDPSRVVRRAMVSATVAPISITVGWSVAAAVQPGGFDSWRGTVSALAAYGATDRWIMTLAILVLGACHVITASGLYEARRAGRLVLAIGGAATIWVALAPLPESGTSSQHAISAGVAFVALAIWPLFAYVRSPSISWGLRPRHSVLAASILVLLLAAFGLALAYGESAGGVERILITAQASWPLVVVWCAWWQGRRA